MTLMPGRIGPLKVDAKGRVWTPAEKREEILREFDRSGASGVEFARMIGVKYPTFAGWLRRRGARAAGARRRGRPKKEPVQFVEATIPGRPTEPLVVELPRAVRVRITASGQIPLVLELLRSLESC
jgi:transposase-like protein